ncbi:Hpt domain-containing protein [Arthrobacter sp. MPF02]|uniref:Hpt domain-containing protein n=1 Tax=Arthrobacter sp. MPF02 TaxID=3388492 RepID=UPI003984EB5A
MQLAPMLALADDLGCPASALNFLADYLMMLPARIARIVRHLDEQDYERALDALISLKVTSAMTGALETEAGCRAVETFLRNNRWDEARTAASALHRLVNADIVRGPQMLTDVRAELRRQPPMPPR